MKRKILNIGLAVTLLFASSCGKDFLDVNDDPNNPLTAPAPLVFPAAVVSTASVVGGDYAILGGIWSQFWTQNNQSNQYKDIDAFSIRPTNFQNRWTELYAGALNDYKYIKQQADATGDGNLFLMATVMEVYTYQVLTDLYDDIPFSEALQGTANLTPAFDPGQKVYDGLIVRLDEAIAKATGGTSVIGDNDIVFGGDMSEWLAFANTLKLKIYLRQSEARTSVAEAGVRSVFANGNFLAASAAADVFSNTTSQRNPLFEQDQSPALNTPQNLRASRTLFSFLDENSDPRLPVLYIPGTITPPGATTPVAVQRGMEQGSFNASSTEIPLNSTSRARISPVAPVYFISEAESYFLQAEAIVRGWGTGDAQALYEDGVRASFAQMASLTPTFVGISATNPRPAAPTQAQANALLAGAYAFPASGTTEEKIEAIITQKWVALAGTTQGIEAFFERNRTGFPRTSAVPSSTAGGYVPSQFIYPIGGVTGAGNFGRRLLTPDNELTRNPNAQAALKTVTTKVWWAKETL
jgi:hypothetical protein